MAHEPMMTYHDAEVKEVILFYNNIYLNIWDSNRRVCFEFTHLKSQPHLQGENYFWYIVNEITKRVKQFDIRIQRGAHSLESSNSL